MNAKNKNLIIDFISFTLQVDSKKTRTDIHRKISNLKHHKIVKRKYIKKYIRQYHDTWILDILIDGNAFSLKLSYNPIDNKKRFFRVEFNPAKAGEVGVNFLQWLLIYLLGIKLASSIYEQARLTRLDITLDRYGLKQEYYSHVERMTCSELRKIDMNDSYSLQQGRSAQILGNGNLRLTVYDKTAERMFRCAAEIPDNCVRYEFRLRNLECPINKIFTHIKNPFTTLHCYSKKFLKDDFFSREFRRTAKRQGIPEALHQLGNYAERRKYLNRLKRHRRNIINDKSTWKQWGKAVDALRLLEIS